MTRVLRVALLLSTAGCNLVFPLEPTPTVCHHDGLKLCLAFEDDLTDGRADDGSSRHFNATASNVTSVPRTDTENGISLTAASNVVLEHNNAYDLPGPMSIDLWIQHAGVLTGMDQLVVDNSLQYTVLLPFDPAKPQAQGIACQFHVGDNFSRVSVPLSANRWHHLACIYNNVEIRLALDGKVIGGLPGDAPGEIATDGNEFLQIGRGGGGQNDLRTFSGQIDNVRIWDRPLTDDELSSFALE